MVGWTRRNRQARERHERWLKWFNALSPEKQQEVLRRHAEHDKKLMLGLAIALLLFVVASIFTR